MKDTEKPLPVVDKTARLGSILFLGAAWFGLAGLAIWFLRQWHDPAMFLYVWFDVLFALLAVPLVLIPVQLARYMQRKRQ